MNYALSSCSTLLVPDFVMLTSVFLAGYVLGNCFRFLDNLVIRLFKYLRGLIHVK